jgi:hypothetical protein
VNPTTPKRVLFTDAKGGGEGPWTVSVDGDPVIAELRSSDMDVSARALDPLWERLGVEVKFEWAEPPRFHALEWYRVRGRGFVAVVACDVERDRDDSGLKGPVFIDDELFECVGVDRHLPAFPIYPGEKIGLLVRDR